LNNQNLVFRQLFESESSTFTYLIADGESREAVLIDSVLKTADRDLKLIEELELSVKYVLDTHIHADHITGSGHVRDKTNAKSCVSALAAVDCADIGLIDGQMLNFGSFTLKAVATPGHTSSCMSFFIQDMAFTGDAVLIRGCGRTDFQSGSSRELFHSVRERIFSLPEATKIYPAHDYKGFSMSTVAEERRFNPRLKMEVSEAEFVKIMADLKLPAPKNIAVAIPSNLHCGKREAPSFDDKRR
jgi:sulfur dioxygenase